MINNECLKYFLDNFKKTGTVIEIGTKRWNGVSNTRAALWPDAKHIKVDYLDGEDVDVVCDAEKLSETFEENSADAIFTASTFEHIRHPWIAAKEILKVLKPGGIFFCQTHQSFPIHGYPEFYFTFSKEALEVLFYESTEKVSCYEHPCKIIPPAEITIWDPSAPAFLNCCIAGKK